MFLNINDLYSDTSSIKTTNLVIMFRTYNIHQLIEQQVLPLHKFVSLYTSRFKILDYEHELVNYEIRLDQNKNIKNYLGNIRKRESPIIYLIQTTAVRILVSILPALHSIKEKDGH